MRSFSVLFLLLALTGPALASEVDLVRLSEADPRIALDPRYAGSNNFVGERIRGYGAREVMLSRPAATALARAQDAAEARGLTLLVFDAYRPQRAVDHFVAWAADLDDLRTKPFYYPRVPKAELFERGYIAARSGHSRGSTVDLTLAREGRTLDMGTPFDFFDERSHTESPLIEGEAMRNRLLLKRIMETAGFRNYAKEWWHYTLEDEPYPDTYFNIPIN